MNRPICLKRIVALSLLLSGLFLVGCAQQEGATSLTTAKTSAPPPSNLTPEQKKAYDEAVKSSQPSSALPAGK